MLLCINISHYPYTRSYVFHFPLIYHYWIVNRVKRPNGGETTTPIEESKMEKLSGTVSSHILLPFPMLTVLLIFSTYLQT